MTSDLDKFVLFSMPHLIALKYQQAIDYQGEDDAEIGDPLSFEERTNYALQVFDIGVRALAIGLVTQYLNRDKDNVISADLNRIIRKRMPISTLATWVNVFFASLDAYKGQRTRFFIPELYDLYWDPGKNDPRPDVEEPFHVLTQHWYQLTYGKKRPTDEAGWREMYDDVMRELQTILEQFRFLDQYEVIYVTKIQGANYFYDSYTGLKVHADNKPKPPEATLQKNRFYLADKDHRSFLDLHPLLLQWKQEFSQDTEGSENDVPAILDVHGDDEVSYRLTSSWILTSVQSNEIIREFVKAIRLALKKYKVPPPARTEKLLWSELQDVASDMSDGKMSAVRNKYDGDLYVQRRQVKQQFDDFLQSDKTGLIITGKSGVGKSNFLISLLDEYKETMPIESCFVMYNAAKLEIPEESSWEKIFAKDFATHLTISDGGDTKILNKINEVEDIEQKKVVICFDAVNENANPQELFKNIDALIETHHARPWLKIVVTSRPEAWKAISSGITLAQNRYYSNVQTGIELTEFDLELKIDNFTMNELEVAYDKYRQKYGLKTEYNELKEIREILRDPLALKLLAKAYQGKPLPEAIKEREIVERYIKSLKGTGKDDRYLEQDDLEFLEKEILARMLDIGHYAKAVTSSEVVQAYTSTSVRLSDLIHDDTRVKDPEIPGDVGIPVNISFQRLVDADILTAIEDINDYEVSFKYERFYDYFGGKRILELAKAAAEGRDKTYRRFASNLQNHPYMWGPLKYALDTEWEQGQRELFVSVAQVPKDSVKFLLVESLTEYGRESLTPVQAVLDSLISLGQNESPMSPENQSAHKVAIEIAANLEVAPILAHEARSPSGSVRLHTAQAVFRLWNQNADISLEVLNDLSDEVKGLRGLFRVGILEFLAGASTLIVFESFGETGKFDEIQRIWQRIFDQYRFIVQKMLYLLVPVVVFFGRLLPRSSAINIPEIKHFYRLPPEEREKYSRLLPYLEPGYGDIAELETLILAVSQSRDTLTYLLVWMILCRQGKSRYFELVPVIDQLFEDAVTMKRPGPMVIAVLNCLYYLLADPMAEYAADALDRFQGYVWRYYEQSHGIYESVFADYQHFSMDLLPIRTFEITGNYYPDKLVDYLEQSKQDESFALQRILVGKYHEGSFNLVYSIAGYGYPKLAIKMAELLVDTQADESQEELDEEIEKRIKDTQDGLYQFLALLRRSEPRLVDEFRERHHLSTELLRAAEANVSEQSIGENLGYVSQAAILSLADFDAALLLIRAAPTFNRTQPFLTFFIRTLVNLIYGGSPS